MSSFCLRFLSATSVVDFHELPQDYSSSKSVAQAVVIISPYEANKLLPEVRRSEAVTLRMYAPSQNLAFTSLDKLSLCNVPAAPTPIKISDIIRTQLTYSPGSYTSHLTVNIKSFATSSEWPTSRYWRALAVDDGFILGGNGKTTLSQSQLKFLEALMSQVRKECQEIDKTHVGNIVAGSILCPSDFQSYTVMSIRTRGD